MGSRNRKPLRLGLATALAAGTLVATQTMPTSAVPPGAEVVFDDFEHGGPVNNGWFAFGSATGGGGIDPNFVDLPPNNGETASMQTGWGGAPGFYGGFGLGNNLDLSETANFNFWISPDLNDPGQSFTLEINLQEDDDNDGVEDEEFQFNCVVSATGPCAEAGGGWQRISIPFADFSDDNSFLNGGNGEFDPISDANGGNGELINVVVAVIGDGTAVNFRTDYWTFTEGRTVDNFENDLPFTSSTDGELLGFYTFQGDGSVAVSENAVAPALAAAGAPNTVLQMDVDVASFAGYIHAFSNVPGDSWVTQDWSTSEGISFWMYGTNSGTQMFIDILDNRNPGSTTDNAERYTVPFADDFTGWQLLQFPFDTFVRKEIGNGAPADGLGLFEMHGYAIGTLGSKTPAGTPGPNTFLIDEVSVYGIGEPPALAVNFANLITRIDEGTTGAVGVKLNRPMGPDDPAQVSIDFATERSNAVPLEEYTPASGTLIFTNGGPTELAFPLETFDDTKFEGDEQIVIRLSNPVDVERGALFQGSVLITDTDDFDPKLLDDFEQGGFLWDTAGGTSIEAVRTESGDPDARPGQDPVENVGAAVVPLHVTVEVEGDPCGGARGVVPVQLLSTPTFDATTVDHTTVVFGGATEIHVDRRTGEARRHVEDANRDGLDDLVFHFRRSEIDLCGAGVLPFNGSTFDGQPITAGGSEAALIRDFPLGQDWTGTDTLDFWYYGAGGGEDVTVTLKDNRAPDPGPAGWTLAWADEFDDSAGNPPNPANWAYEIGDTTPDGKNGWGNEELQYYTNDPANAQTDGNGNLVIMLDEADGSQECYYGPCEFESARLITQNKAEFAYGRVESRIQVPTGGDGLWPAFWSLGTDITYNPWPGAGEIDVMEYVSRVPNEIFGTIHGPGYNGGNAFGDIYDFSPKRVDEQYHTFVVEWQPNLITWYVDGTQYHQAEPADVPGPWVFEKPFFLLLNFAIGGNFGGAIDPANTYPQQYLVDYVRVFQGPDTAERFETSFTDDVAGWTEISISMTDFVRSADQPAGAPNDGLGLDEVWGYSLGFPTGTATGEARIDLARRVPVPPPTSLVVTNLDDSGPGSLREALALIADGGSITLDPALAGGTMTLTSGQLLVDRSVVIDAAAGPVTISAGETSRVVEIVAGAVVSMSDVVLRDGVAAPTGGGVLNNGVLSLERVVVTDNLENSTGTNFAFGGGGIYNGDGATLNLTDSTVSNNATVDQPGGGVYGSFGSTINITDSTISNNYGADVAGGLRTLGDANITGSTISGNTSVRWHGGGIFATDGTVSIVDTAIVDNFGASGTAGGLMVATFGAPVTVTLRNSTVTGNQSYGCQVEGDHLLAVLSSLGGNTFSDGSCNPIGSDVILP